MIVVSSVATTLFLGGWLRPFPNVAALHFLDIIPSWTWFLIKSFVFLYIFIWVRATLPRYRYDQLMRLGWKVLIPLAIVNLVATGISVLLSRAGAGRGASFTKAGNAFYVMPRILGSPLAEHGDTVQLLFLVLDFLFVSALMLLLGAPFLAVIQVLVCRRGSSCSPCSSMLVNLKRAGDQDPHRRGKLGFGLAAAVLLEFGVILASGYLQPSQAVAAAPVPVTGNTEQVGWLLYTSYLIPFEIASMLLLVAMIGAIVLAKREL
jgi:NADH:ubiquinone oxidoreductase subunit 6 (subunit J)